MPVRIPRLRLPRTSRLAVAALAVGGALLLPAPGAAQEGGVQSVLDKTFDVLVLRPLGAANTLVGAAYFVPAVVLSAPGGKDPMTEAWERFVVRPAEYVYKRPLGEF